MRTSMLLATFILFTLASPVSAQSNPCDLVPPAQRHSCRSVTPTAAAPQPRHSTHRSSAVRVETRTTDRWENEPQARSSYERRRHYEDIARTAVDLARCERGDNWLADLFEDSCRRERGEDLYYAAYVLPMEYTFRPEPGYFVRICDDVRNVCFSGQNRVEVSLDRHSTYDTDVKLEVEMYRHGQLVGWDLFEDEYDNATGRRARESRGTNIVRVTVSRGGDVDFED